MKIIAFLWQKSLQFTLTTKLLDDIRGHNLFILFIILTICTIISLQQVQLTIFYYNKKLKIC